MPKIDEMQLKKEIKSGDFKNAYLLYGEESYLKEYYANELKNKNDGEHNFNEEFYNFLY